MNLWGDEIVVGFWAGLLVFACFVGGWILKRNWRGGILTALAGPVVLLPFAYAGGLGMAVLGEILVRCGLRPIGLDAGAELYVNLAADLAMLATPFGMLVLYCCYERGFAVEPAVEEDSIPLPLKGGPVVIRNRKLLKIPLRKNSGPKLVRKRKTALHHCRTVDGMVGSKLPRRLVLPPRPVKRSRPHPDTREA